MKQLSINSDENAFIGKIISLFNIALIIGLLVGAYLIVSNPDVITDFFSDLGEGIGGGLFGAISGAIGGFFGGAWNLGKDIGEKTSFVPEFIKSLKFW